MENEIKTKKCSKCDEIKQLTEFGLDKREFNGLKSRCKKCRSSLEKKKRVIPFIAPEGYKRCTFCKEIKLTSDFKKDRCKKDGLNSNCNKCVLKIRYKKPHILAWRGLIRRLVVLNKLKKESKTIDLLGYSAIDLKNHIESLFTEGMTWDNHGEWHIDHIKRVCEFNDNTHPSIVNALTNLRPLWATTREINGIIYKGNLNRG